MKTVKNNLILSMLTASILIISAESVYADNLNLPDPALLDKGPTRGIEMNQVLEQYGEPSNRSAQIGQPPISRWVYATFKVYFENDRVIHSVSR